MTRLPIVGMFHLDTAEFVQSLPAGEPITLIRDPGNEFDPCAIQVWAKKRHVGFVKAHEARQLAAKMDAVGKVKLTGAFVPGRLPEVEIMETEI